MKRWYLTLPRLDLRRYIVLSLLFGIYPEAWALNQITDSRIGEDAVHTRIVLESDKALRSSTIIMRNPDRLILDLMETDIGKALKQLPEKLNPKSPLVKHIQISPISNQRVRLEIFLRAESDPNIFSLNKDAQHGYRLVIDIYPSSSNISSRELAPPPSTFAIKNDEIKSQDKAIEGKPDAIGTLEEKLLEIEINQLPNKEAAFVLFKDGRLMVKTEDLKRWRIKLPGSSSIRYEGIEYYPLDSIRGMSYQLDEAALKVSLQANAGAFEATGISGTANGFTKPDPTMAGGFFNYDLFTTYANGVNTSSGLFELGMFGQWGVLTSNHLARKTEISGEVVRLDTTFTQDQPDRLATFQLGDVISNPGNWGGAARLGGIQYATNFNTQPGFIAFPLPGVSGEAILPSTVDLYVNDALRLRRDVPMGPFSIQSLPVVSGPGEARLVIRDILGREQIITQPFFASNQLLQAGLHAYSYEIGAIREHYSLKSNDYGRLALAATHRVGLSDRFTGELHSELLQDQQTIGLGGTYLLAPTLISASIAGSQSDRGSGGLVDFGIEYRAQQINFGINSRMMTYDFIHIGIPNSQLAPRFINRAFASYAMPGLGNLSINYTEQDYRDRQDLRLLGANYNFPLWDFGYMNISVLQFLGEDSRTVVGMTFTKPFGDRTTGSINSTFQPGFYENVAQIQRSLPVGSGYGYRALLGDGENGRRQLAINAQSEVGTYLLETSQFRGEDAYRANIAGGIAFVDHDLFLSRKLIDSFTIVEVPEHSNVRIYADNQLVGKTDSRGLSLIPRVRAYQKNKIRIEQSDIPLDSEVTQLTADTSPYFRSATKVRFPVKKNKSATLQLRHPDGSFLPAGAIAKLNENNEEFPLGSEGRLYLSGLKEENNVLVEWQDQKCRFKFRLQNSREILPDLGVFICESSGTP